MTNYNDGKWHGWNGGECPVHPDTVVVVQLACDTRIDVEESGYADRAETLRWAHFGASSDIIAFRVVKEHKEPREFWIVGGANGYCLFGSKDYAEVDARHKETTPIHVREVQP